MSAWTTCISSAKILMVIHDYACSDNAKAQLVQYMGPYIITPSKDPISKEPTEYTYPRSFSGTIFSCTCTCMIQPNMSALSLPFAASLFPLLSQTLTYGPYLLLPPRRPVLTEDYSPTSSCQP